MPKCTLKVPFEAFNGAVMDADANSGQVVFGSPRAGKVSRRWSRPNQPYSAFQLLARNYTISCSQAYKALTKTQGEDWTTNANMITRTDILGNNFTLAGLAYYNLINWHRLASGTTQSATVPTTTFPATTQLLTSVTRTNATTLTFVGTTSGAEIVKAFIRVTDPLPGHSSKARVNQLSCNTTGVNMNSNYVTVTGNAFTLALAVQSAKFTAAQNVGVGILCFNAAWQCTNLLFVKNIALL